VPRSRTQPGARFLPSGTPAESGMGGYATRPTASIRCAPQVQ